MNIEDMKDAVREYEIMYATFRVGKSFSDIEKAAIWDAVSKYDFDVYIEALHKIKVSWGANKVMSDHPQPYDVAEACRIIASKRARDVAIREASNRQRPHHQLEEHMDPAQQAFMEKVLLRQNELVSDGIDRTAALLRATRECIG